MLFAAVFLLTTVASASLVENKVHKHFYQAMQRATPAHDRSKQALLRQRLLKMARPRVLEQGDDAVANDDGANGDDQYVNNDGLDLREYAFKYVVCSTFSSEILKFPVWTLCYR